MLNFEIMHFYGKKQTKYNLLSGLQAEWNKIHDCHWKLHKTDSWTESMVCLWGVQVGWPPLKGEVCSSIERD